MTGTGKRAGQKKVPIKNLREKKKKKKEGREKKIAGRHELRRGKKKGGQGNLQQKKKTKKRGGLESHGREKEAD